MNAYEKLQTARSQTRPTARSYIEKLFQERTELHGDRKYADDAAIIGGIGMLGDIPATFIGIERGRNLEERIRCNFGCPMPEGYRKALRLMTGGKIPQTCYLLCGYLRCILRRGGRGTRTGTGDCR